MNQMRLLSAIAVTAVIGLLGAGCGDDGSGGDGGAAPAETTEAEIVMSAEFCAAFGDPVWVEFNNADQRTEAQVARMEELSATMVAEAPEELTEEVAAMDTGTTAVVTVWRDAGFDSTATDTAALTDASSAAADSVHRIEGLAEQSCDIERGFGGLLATG